MSWPQAFAFSVMCASIAFAAWAYCRYRYLNDKSYRDSLLKVMESEDNDK